MESFLPPVATAKQQGMAILLAGLACTSCAAAGQITMPVSNVAAKASSWPPLAVDGYTTSDGQHHSLNGGHMVAHGDSVTFVSPGPSYADRLRSPRVETGTLHRDSVRTVDVLLHERDGSQAGAVAGGILIGVLGSVLLLYGALASWAFY